MKLTISFEKYGWYCSVETNFFLISKLRNYGLLKNNDIVIHITSWFLSYDQASINICEFSLYEGII